MGLYQTIDPILDDWAEDNSIRWYARYQDTEVRLFILKPDSKAHVSVAVDAPKDHQTIVRIGQNRKGLSRLSRKGDFPTSETDLAKTLDHVLRIANEWLADDDHL